MSDFRHAFRTLAATPIVTTAAVLSLALGIGSNTAIFSLIHSLVFRPLPVAESHRLAVMRGDGAWSNPVWEQIRARESLFAGAFAWGTPRFDLSEGGQSQMVEGLYVSGSFFDVLGVRAQIGRTLNRSDDLRGSGIDGPVAVVSHDFWRSHFGGGADVLGRELVIRGVPFTVVGVAPRGFNGPDIGRSFDIAVPLASEGLLRGEDSLLDDSNSRFLRIMVRLKPDQSLEAATAALRGVQPQIRAATLSPDLSGAFRENYLKPPFTFEAAAGGESRLTGWVRPLYLVFAVAACVLLIACSNITNLLLARATTRRQELSVRVALGASRLRLLRLLLTESFLIAGAGAALGMAFSSWTSQLLVSQLSTQVTRVHVDLSLDWRVFAFTAALACGSALMFGVLPARRAMRANPSDSLQAARSIAGGRSLVPGVFVVAQVALSLVLVIAAGLFGRTFAALASAPLGFESERLLVVNVTAPSPKFKAEVVPGLYRRVLDAVAAIPGVDRAAMSIMVPISASSSSTVRLDTDPPETRPRQADVNAVTPGWFGALNIPIRRGRDFTEADRTGSPAVALVNEAFVRAYLQGRDPIGRTINATRKDLPVVEIVGVVGDSVYRALREAPPPTIYYAFAQQRAWSSVYLNVRAATDSPDALTPAIAKAVAQVDRGLFLQFRTIDDQIRASLTRERLLAMLTGFFGALGMLLAGIGLFGVMSYSVTQRRAEISVRVAIGASPARIVRLVLGRVALLFAIGIAAGATLTWWLTQFVSATQLYGIHPRDLSTIAGAALLLAAVAAFASWWPVRRAARIDPAPLLREA